MRTLMAISAVAGLSFLATPSVQAASISGLYTTGVDDSGNLLPLGSIDPHYTVVQSNTNAFLVTDVRPNYIANNPTSGWIWQNSNGQPTNVTRSFSTTFDLTGFDPSTALITGNWAADNLGLDILINGLSTGQQALVKSPPSSLNPFQFFTPFTINTGFNPGLNTITFVVQDRGVVAGFRVGEISGTADRVSTPVPEPASILGVLAVFVLGSTVKRNQKLQKSASNN